MDKSGESLAHKTACRFLLVVATGEDHTRIRPDTTYLTEGSFTAHLRHGHVEQHRNDLLRMPAKHLHSFVPVNGCQNVKPEPLQD